MSTAVAALMFVLLLAVAIAHLLWALGGSWPIRDPAVLPRVVVGREGVERVPRLASFGVFLLTFASGIVALALTDPAAGGAGLSALGVVCALVFAARGVLGYTSWWQRQRPLEPFRSLDRRNYSPLCLALTLGYLVLVLMRLT